MRCWGTATVVWSVAAVAALGCGGSDERLSRREYQASIHAVVEDAREPTAVYTDLVVRPRGLGQCVSLMDEFEEQVDDLVDRVAELRPPAPVQHIHDDFVEAARTSVDRVGAVRDEVARGELSCGDELNRELYGMRSSDTAERAIARLERHGYVVFGD